MIAGAWITLWTTLASFAVGLLPDYHLPDGVFTGVHYVMATISPWSIVFPVVPALTVLTLMMTFELTIMIIRLFIGIVALLRGSGKPEI